MRRQGGFWFFEGLPLAVLLVVSAIGLAAWGFDALSGHYVAVGAQQERDRAQRAAQQQVKEAAQLGARLASQARSEAQAARDQAARLQTEVSHARLSLVRTVGACPGDAALPGAAGGAAAGAAVGAATQPGAQQLPDGPPDGGEPRLTAAAVRLWNSALAGRHVPYGACGADDPADPACTAASALDLDDAWSNHVENAARCRIDRIHLQRLIDYLRKRGEGN